MAHFNGQHTSDCRKVGCPDDDINDEEEETVKKPQDSSPILNTLFSPKKLLQK